MSRQTATVAGTRYSWHEAGKGTPLVLVHGIGSDSQVWAAQLDAFASRFRVIAWDAPGYGSADHLAAEQPAATDYGTALATLLDALGVGGGHFVAHSLGGIISLALLSRWTGRAHSLTLLSPVAGAGRLDAKKRETIRQARIADLERLGMQGFAQLRGRAVLGSQASEAAAARHLEIMTGIGARAYRQAWEMMCASDIFPLLRHATAPAQVICGVEDTVAPEAVCREIAEKAGANLVRLPGVGHSAAVEAPDRLNECLDAFLSSVSAPRA